MKLYVTKGFFSRLNFALFGCLYLSLNQIACAADSPRSVYDQYHQKFESVEAYNELSQFLPKEELQRIEKDSATGAINKFLTMRRAYEPNESHVVSETISGDTATLKVHGKFTNVGRLLAGVKPSDDPRKAPVQYVFKEGQETDGVVAMVLQDGTWRVKQTTWNPVVFHDTKVLSSKGQALQHSDAARQTTTKFVKGKLFEQNFGLIKAQYDGSNLLLDGGEMPNEAAMKFRAKVVISFARPQNFPGTIYKIGLGQTAVTTSKGTIKSPNVLFTEMIGATINTRNLTNVASSIDGYSMVLKFMTPTADGQLPGYIDLVVPEYGSTHVTGFFYATRSSKPIDQY